MTGGVHSTLRYTEAERGDTVRKVGDLSSVLKTLGGEEGSSPVLLPFVPASLDY